MMNDGWTDVGDGGSGAEPTPVSAYQRVSVSASQRVSVVGQYRLQDTMWVR